MTKAPINVLVIGSGGREHAFAWKISQSPLLKSLFIAPGNTGTEILGTNVALDVNQFEEVSDFIQQNQIQLVIVGPEVPLVGGLVDALEDSCPKTMVIGPKAVGAQLEGSKAFAKQFMERHQIPTASYREFSSESLEAGKHYIKSHPLPVVLKADGLAAGKGVVICESIEDALAEFVEMLSGKFGAASQKVVVESYLDGIEFSVFALTDGNTFKILPVAKDYKRIGEGDTGPNTGGMGSISPVSFATDGLMQKVKNQIIEPTIAGLKKDGIPYQGFIFFGLIAVDGDPYVIEYNCRMGDPETQSVLPRLKNDLLELCVACASNNLQHQSIEIDKRSVATIVLVSGGYPGPYEKGKLIGPLPTSSDLCIFHAGVKRNEDQLLTAGGRVLAISSFGSEKDQALERAYRVADQINFEGVYFRRDIGYDL